MSADTDKRCAFLQAQIHDRGRLLVDTGGAIGRREEHHQGSACASYPFDDRSHFVDPPAALYVAKNVS